MAKRKTVAADVAATAVETTAITSIKGFGADLVCKGTGYRFQYEIGQTYTHDGPVRACKSGFHAYPISEHPLNVFSSYAPAGSRFFEVEQSGETSKEDAKLASATITIGIELTLGDLVKRAWDYVWSRATLETGSQATGELGAASATGNRGAASALGTYSAAMASGFNGKARAVEGSALFLVERIDDFGPDHGKIAHVWAGVAGLDGVKPDVFYTLRNGQLVEVA